MDTKDYRQVNEQVLRTLSFPGKTYWRVVGFLVLSVVFGMVCWGYQLATGIGASGKNHPVMWALYVTNFVFWIGIAHSGTLISAVLFLFRAKWRRGISRSAEAMTIFAVMIAGLFPIIHLGRPWIIYWLLPYPNQRDLWPNFTSPLIFDVFAVSTYFIVSLLFWYIGLIPDLATARDHVKGPRKKIYGFLSMGWIGTQRQWHHYGTTYLLLAGLATPLVVSVHSVVSWDFANIIVPGYHSTIFPPYFVDGAIHSGLAMVLTLLIPLRRIFRFEDLITLKDLENIAKTLVLTGLFIAYSYTVEYFMAWYSGNEFERQLYHFRATGHYGYLFWTMVFCNALVPLLLFSKRIRTNIRWLFGISIIINIGMWLERFVIVVGSMTQDFLPYQWGFYRVTWVDGGIMFASFCLFFLLFILFAKFLPSVSMNEIKEGLPPPLRMRKEAPLAG